MTGVRYKIPMLSAKAILAYAKPVGEDIYSFNLNKAETAKLSNLPKMNITPLSKRLTEWKSLSAVTAIL